MLLWIAVFQVLKWTQFQQIDTFIGSIFCNFDGVAVGGCSIQSQWHCTHLPLLVGFEYYTTIVHKMWQWFGGNEEWSCRISWQPMMTAAAIMKHRKFSKELFQIVFQCIYERTNTKKYCGDTKWSPFPSSRHNNKNFFSLPIVIVINDNVQYIFNFFFIERAFNTQHWIDLMGSFLPSAAAILSADEIIFTHLFYVHAHRNWDPDFSIGTAIPECNEKWENILNDFD